MIKKLLVFIVAASALMSCLNGGYYTESFTEVATFEYSENYDEVFGPDSLYFDVEHGYGCGWHNLWFRHKVDKASKAFEGGFMLSHLAYPKSGDVSGLANNKYRANAKLDNTFNTYMVFEQSAAMPDSLMIFNFSQSANSIGTCIMKSCYVNNTVAAAQAIEEHFLPGDKMILKAKGYREGTETGVAEITLAEKSSVKDSIVYTWTPFDLSKLGTIDIVNFELVIPEGKDIPATVCIDNVMASITGQYN